MKKENLKIFALGILFLLLIAPASAKLTGKLYNGKMVISLESGETVQKHITIENVNEVPVTINLMPIGDLAESINLEEEEFILKPGEKKKSYFTITASKPGTTESKINILFTPPEGNGLGLASEIIVIAPGENAEDTNSQNNEQNTSQQSQNTSDTQNNETTNTTSEDSGFSFNPTGRAIQENSNIKLSPLTILIISTIILILTFVALIIYSKKKSKKKVGRQGG